MSRLNFKPPPPSKHTHLQLLVSISLIDNVLLTSRSVTIFVCFVCLLLLIYLKKKKANLVYRANSWTAWANRETPSQKTKNKQQQQQQKTQNDKTKII